MGQLVIKKTTKIVNPADPTLITIYEFSDGARGVESFGYLEIKKRGKRIDLVRSEDWQNSEYGRAAIRAEMEQ